MDGQFSEPRLRARLQDEAAAQNLEYLAYVLIPRQGGEGVVVEVGQPPGGLHKRAVESMPCAGGRAELHWTPAVDYGRAGVFLTELEKARDIQSTLAERLHRTVCQSLTAAHLHLELGLMSEPEAAEEFVLARALVHEATVSVRDLMDELTGESA